MTDAECRIRLQRHLHPIRIRLSDRTRDLGWSLPGANPQLYRTEFIGKDGKVLKVDETLRPSYNFTGQELYVRARITNSDGQMAWTQPVFPKSVGVKN